MTKRNNYNIILLETNSVKKGRTEMKKIKVTVWNEFVHEKTNEAVKALYPNGIHGFIKDFLSDDENLEITLASLDMPEQGLPDEVLENTDVLLWWSHAKHDMVSDELVDKIQKRVYLGKMGFIALHSSHFSKPFRRIVGTNGNLYWGRNQKEIVWNMMPGHPIAAGIPDHFCLEEEEVYSEPFYIPQPDAVVFGSWFEDGNIFRSGCCFLRGAGKLFYFQPGHETCKSYYNPWAQRIIRNAIYWANPNEIGFTVPDGAPMIESPAIKEFEK